MRIMAVVCILLTGLGLGATIHHANPEPDHYLTTGVVESVGDTTTTDVDVTIMTSDGNLWLYTTDKGYALGDNVAIMFDTMNTDDITDDHIISMHPVH